MTQRSVHISVTGRVQGVGYRAWFETEAAARQLRGWVRNRRDGSVEALICGPEASVGELLASAWRGPPAAGVAGVEVSEAPPPGGSGFRVLPTE